MRCALFLSAAALASAFSACGFDGVGGIVALDVTQPSDGGRSEAGGGGDGPATGDGGGPSSLDGGLMTADDAAADGSIPHEAGPPLPTDPGPPLAYVLSTRFWTFDPTTGAWAGGTALPTSSCPSLDELAVDPFGGVFAVGDSATRLYRVDATTLTNPICTAIGPARAGYPQSLAFAPRGTLDPYDEKLVGFAANGDYVRIDTTTGAVSIVTAGALAGMNVGDLVNVGLDGYVAVNGGSCGSGDCVWKISLSTGVPIAPGAAAARLPSTSHVAGLAQWAGKLQAFCGPDEVYAFDPANAAGAVMRTGPPGYSNVFYHGAGSRTIAPTN